MNLLITGALKCTENELDIFKSEGHNCFYMQNECDALPCNYSWVEGIIGNGIFLNHSIEKFTNLKFIQLTSAGLDRVPIDYIKSHNIKLYNAKGVYSIPMAEFVVCGILQLFKQSRFFIKNQNEHKWEKHRELLELNKKTVCIVGCGSVGNECAKRLKAFGCKLLGVDLSPYSSDLYNKIYSISELYSVLPLADVLILTLPLTKETKHLISKEALTKIKQGSIIANISRGAVVDTDALIKSLQKGNLFGAVLDVFEDEPLNKDSPLWDMENVIITPHNSFVGEGNKERLFNLILGNLKGVYYGD